MTTSPPEVQKLFVDATRAESIFWEKLYELYPEMTTGDSLMVDEPVNAMALWLSLYSNVSLDADQLTLQDICLDHGTDQVRFYTSVQACIDTVKDKMKDTYPDLGEPTAFLAEQLRSIASTHLSNNFPHPAGSEPHP